MAKKRKRPPKGRGGRRGVRRRVKGDRRRRSSTFRKRSAAAKLGHARRRERLQTLRTLEETARQTEADFERELARRGIRRPVIVEGGAPIIIFDLPEDLEGHSGFQPIDEATPGLVRRTWHAHLRLTRENVVLVDDPDVRFPAVEWYYTGAALIRFFQGWRDKMRIEHPEAFEESPSIGLIRLALVS